MGDERSGGEIGCSLGSLVSLLAPLTVWDVAEAQCQPPRTNNYITYYHDGWIRNLGGTTARGTSSFMSNYDPWVQPSGGNSSAWTMLTRTDHVRRAQIGWYEFAYDYRRTFVQYTYNDNVITYEYSPESSGPGQFSTYATLYDPGVYPNPPTWTFQVNGVTKHSVASLQWTPNEGQIAGETMTRSTQMPGGTNGRQLFANMKILYSGTWNDFGGTGVNTQPAYFGQTQNHPTFGEIWDKACYS